MKPPTEAELDRLKSLLAEAEETLDAIRFGRVDAVVVEAPGGDRIYTMESEDLPYRQFLEQMGEGAASLDERGTLLFCNRFLCDLVGTSRSELLGSPFERVVAEESVEAYREALCRDEPTKLAARLATSDSTSVPVQLSITPVALGPVRRYTLVVTDLTERERLREIRKAHEAAEAASLAKDRFLAALAHELRSPLGVVLGWTGLLLSEAERVDASTRRALEVIKRNTELQQSLIEDLLDIARAASGKLRLDRREVRLGELAHSTVAALGPAAITRGVELGLALDDDPAVFVDPKRLDQVLQNLVGNALKFTPAGGRVTVRVGRSGGRARLRVEDDGRGIDPSLLPRVFQLFRQGEVEDDEVKDGLGLGLAIAKQLVELHEGTVWAESEGIGRGAVFTVELPLADLGERRPEWNDTAHEHDRRSKGVRVLLVDDVDDARELTAHVLRRLGAEVVAAADAAAALALLETTSIDVIVSDLAMPHMDGFELARRVHARNESAPPMIALSALPKDDHVERTVAAGFVAFLPKPADERLLAALLGSLATTMA